MYTVVGVVVKSAYCSIDVYKWYLNKLFLDWSYTNSYPLFVNFNDLVSDRYSVR